MTKITATYRLDPTYRRDLFINEGMLLPECSSTNFWAVSLSQEDRKRFYDCEIWTLGDDDVVLWEIKESMNKSLMDNISRAFSFFLDSNQKFYSKESDFNSLDTEDEC